MLDVLRFIFFSTSFYLFFMILESLEREISGLQPYWFRPVLTAKTGPARPVFFRSLIFEYAKTRTAVRSFSGPVRSGLRSFSSPGTGLSSTNQTSDSLTVHSPILNRTVCGNKPSYHCGHRTFLATVKYW